MIETRAATQSVAAQKRITCAQFTMGSGAALRASRNDESGKVASYSAATFTAWLSCAASHFSASSAAMQPMPAAVTA